MARNIAKSFANMTLVYWEPIVTGVGVAYEKPVEFLGKYIGNVCLDANGAGSFAVSANGMSSNLVLYYKCKTNSELIPKINGYVSWDTSLSLLTAAGLASTQPDHLPNTHKIDTVNSYVMLDAKTVSTSNMAWIMQVA